MSTKRKKIKTRYKIPLVLAGIYLVVIVYIIPVFANNQSESYKEDFQIYEQNQVITVGEIDSNRIELLTQRYEKDLKIQRLQNYLVRKNKVFYNKVLSEIIIEESEKVGADYRIIAGVMGKESGFCNAPYKTYNCFGWLNGVQYGSYEEAFRSIVPGVARYAKGLPVNVNSLVLMGQRYGAVNYQAWGEGVYKFAIGI